MISAIIGSTFCAENLRNSIFAAIKTTNTTSVDSPKGRKIIRIPSNIRLAIAPIRDAFLQPNFTATEPTTALYIATIAMYLGAPFLGDLASIIALKRYHITNEEYKKMYGEKAILDKKVVEA